MENSVKHFVRRILAVHLLLLLLLLAVVTLAARRVYMSARNQAFSVARLQQTHLAEQTAHGIENFYNSILQDLNLLKPDEESESDLPDLPSQPTPPRAYTNMGVARQAMGAMLAHQLEGRAYLFLVDEQLRPHTLGAEDRPTRPTLGANKNGSRGLAPTTAPSPHFEEQIISRFGPWLKDVRAGSISSMQLIDDRSIKLVAVPLFVTVRQTNLSGTHFTPRRAGWLVSAVSARPIELDFLADLGQHDVSGAFLVDDSITVIAASQHKLVGTRLNTGGAPELDRAFASTAPTYNGAAQITERFSVGAQEFEPAMISVSPLKVMGAQWCVVMASPLDSVDAVVRDLARKALYWTVFVAVSMTAILVSTAGQLILSRLRLEQVRHQTLKNELRQARQIQLAWLPQKTKTTTSRSRIDIASLNQPATHISGDFYNFFETPDGRTAVIIGDVTGHGTAAAFLMATTQLLIRNLLPQYCDPGQCLDDVNRQLTNQVFNGQFVTMQILLINPDTGEVDIATAGHPAPLIADGETFESVNIEPQLVAGVDPKTKYATERFQLPFDASLLLYTDGVIETEDRQGNRLRLDGLKRGIGGKVDNAEALLQRAVSVVNSFRHGRDLKDDLTMVAVHFLAPRMDDAVDEAEPSTPLSVTTAPVA